MRGGCLHSHTWKEPDNPQFTQETGTNPKQRDQPGSALLVLGRAAWGQVGGSLGTGRWQPTPRDIFPPQGAKPTPRRREQAPVPHQGRVGDGWRWVTPPRFKSTEKRDVILRY